MTEWFCVQERYKNSLFPVYFIVEVMTREMASFTGKPLHKGILIHRGPHVQYWLQTKKWEELQQTSLRAVQKNPKLVGKLVKEFQKKAPVFLKFIRKVHEIDLTQKSNSELLEYYNQYCRYYKEVGVLGEPVAFCVKDALATHLENYLRQQLREKWLEKKFAEFFSALVSPTVPSFATREEQELIKISVKAQKKGIRTVQSELEKHAQEFFWLPYDYEGEIWGKQYFESVLAELIKKPASDLKAQMDRQKKQFMELKQKQKKFVQEAGIDSYHQQLFQALRDASQAMDLKKEVLTQSHWYKNSLMKEIAKRLGIPFYYTYFVTPEEMKMGLLEGKLDKKRIELRQQHCVSICQDGKTIIETGENAKEWEQKVVTQTAVEESKELHGTCACPGSAIGKARVLLNSNQIHEMREGEVLVTQATTPDFVPAMKKAKAIITNEGGITSHAAIVSRELGVPCIVGVANATKQIKTGDLIDVHAASGTIKKIESAK